MHDLTVLEQLPQLIKPYQRPDARVAAIQVLNTLLPFLAIWAGIYLLIDYSFWLTCLPYKYWATSHNHHHGHNGLLWEHRGIGDIPLLTVREFKAKNRLKRIPYMLLRNGFVLFILLPPFYIFFNNRWNYLRAAVEGSIFYQLPRVLNWLAGNIGYHHIHHLNPLVPNHLLAKCHRDNPLLDRLANKLTIRQSFACLFNNLWDEDQERMISFHEFSRRYGW